MLPGFANPNRLGHCPSMNAREMGRRGGSQKSAAKALGARRNGRRGGRPRKAETLAARLRAEVARLRRRCPSVDLGVLASIV